MPGGKIIVPVNENMAMFCRRTIESRIPYLISKLELIRLSRRAEKKGGVALQFRDGSPWKLGIKTPVSTSARMAMLCFMLFLLSIAAIIRVAPEIKTEAL